MKYILCLIAYIGYLSFFMHMKSMTNCNLFMRSEKNRINNIESLIERERQDNTIGVNLFKDAEESLIINILYQENLKDTFDNKNSEIPLLLLKRINDKYINSLMIKDIESMHKVLKAYPKAISQAVTNEWYNERLSILNEKYIVNYLYKILLNMTERSMNNVIKAISLVESYYKRNITLFVRDLKTGINIIPIESFIVLESALKLLKEDKDEEAFILFSNIAYGINIDKYMSPKNIAEIITKRYKELDKLQYLFNKLDINIKLIKQENVYDMLKFIYDNNTERMYKLLEENPDVIKVGALCFKEFSEFILKKVDLCLFNLDNIIILNIANIFSMIKRQIDVCQLIRDSKERDIASNHLLMCMKILNLINEENVFKGYSDLSILEQTKFIAELRTALLLLLSGFDIGKIIIMPYKCNILAKAIYENKTDLALFLLRYLGLEEYYIDFNGKDALDIAIYKENIPVISEILKKKKYDKYVKAKQIIDAIN